MSTNALGQGTCNLSVNVPASWRSKLGRLAFTRDQSMGEMLRRMIARAAHVWAATRWAVKAGKADIEAIGILKRAMEDGIGPDDRVAFERAIQLIQRSADLDAKVAEAATL